MSDTTQEGPSGGKLCTECERPFGKADDNRYSRCLVCRTGHQEKKEEPTATDPFNPGEEPAASAAPAPSRSALAVAEIPAGEPESIFLDVEKHAPAEIEERDHYWCGATPDCPMSITLGGFEFPKSEGEVVPVGDGQYEMQPNRTQGKIHRMTEANVKLVLEHCANKVIRNFRVEERRLPTGHVSSRFMGDLKSKTGSKISPYRRHESDKPLGQFVYMMRVRHGKDRPVSEPPTMIPRDW